MQHMVVYRTPEGKPSYQQAEGLEDAVRFVERLRNEEQVGDVRIFHMEEVPIEFKTYYRVEVAAPRPVEAADSTAPAPEPDAGAGMVGEPTEPAPVPAGRFGLFGRG